MNNDAKKYCRNYDLIVNCEFLDDDLFSKKLVDCYKYVLSTTNINDSNSINKLIKLDFVMRKYIEDYRFSKKLQDSLDVSGIVNSRLDISFAVFDYVINFSDKYEELPDEIIVNSRWI